MITGGTAVTNPADLAGIRDWLPREQVAGTGLELNHVTPAPVGFSIDDDHPEGAQCGARGAPPPAADAELAEVIGAWPGLPEGTRAAILALTRSASDPNPDPEADARRRRPR